MVGRVLPKNRDELLAAIEGEWNALMQVVDRLTPRQMTDSDSGNWSPKDNLAHLSAWMNFLLKSHLRGMPAYLALGIDEQKFKGLDEDGINAILFERNRHRSTADILSELRTTYRETIKTLTGMDFQTLGIEIVLGNTSEHFAEHRAYIERVLNAIK